tara:strand:+ start:537 stop:818 length:282 start_codon:yes stop_codon:yes gene_type:complete
MNETLLDAKKECLKELRIALTCLENSNSSLANALDNLGDAMKSLREVNIDTELDFDIENIEDTLQGMEAAIDDSIEDTKKVIKDLKNEETKEI